MTITFRLTLEDYYDAGRQFHARKRRLRGSIALGMSIFLFARWMVSGRSARAGFVHLLAIAIIAMIYLFVGWSDRASFKRKWKRAETGAGNAELTVNISEEGIQGASLSERTAWSSFSKYSESNSAFVLYRAGSIDSIFPKRAFDIDGIANFRRLLEKQLQNF